MIIYPAIDISGGRCVRLTQGLMNQKTEYGDPAAMARNWAKQGARWLHVVDLDGAFAGESRNIEAVRGIIREAASLSVQLGGGIRALEDIERWLEAGVSRVILGTAAIESPEMVREAVDRFGACRVACGIDAKAGYAAVRGWTRSTGQTPLELAGDMKRRGVLTIIYTDISRDGALTGPNVAATRELVITSGMEIIGSGGVVDLSDIGALREAGCAGVIVGKALYEGRFELKDAIRQAEGALEEGEGGSDELWQK